MHGHTAGLSWAAEPRAVRRKMTWCSSSVANSIPKAFTAVDRLAWWAPVVGFLALPRYLLGMPDPCACRGTLLLVETGSYSAAQCSICCNKATVKVITSGGTPNRKYTALHSHSKQVSKSSTV